MFIKEIYQKFIISKIKKKLKFCGKKVCITLPVYLKGEECISLDKGAFLDRGSRIEAWTEYVGRKYRPEINIGKNVTFNPNCHIGAINKVVIKDNVLIGANVLITDHSHGKADTEDMKLPPTKRKLFSKGQVIIHENVWIGENVSILPGVSIGRNAIIGANAVVTHDIPANVVAGGNPARVIKEL